MDKERANIIKTFYLFSKDKEMITDLVKRLSRIGYSLQIFMPATADKILKAIMANKLSTPLFPRIEAKS